MTTDSQLIERMENLIREIADVSKNSSFGGSGYAVEARDIAKLLPDKDLEAARKWYSSKYAPGHALPELSEGIYDGSGAILGFLAGIKHGRANPA